MVRSCQFVTVLAIVVMVVFMPLRSAVHGVVGNVGALYQVTMARWLGVNTRNIRQFHVRRTGKVPLVAAIINWLATHVNRVRQRYPPISRVTPRSWWGNNMVNEWLHPTMNDGFL